MKQYLRNLTRFFSESTPRTISLLLFVTILGITSALFMTKQNPQENNQDQTITMVTNKPSFFPGESNKSDKLHIASVGDNCLTSSDGINSDEQFMIQLINNYRVQNGLRALGISPILNKAAAWMAEDMATKGYLSHTDSFGRNSQTRIIECGYPSIYAGGENAGLTGSNTRRGAQSVFNAWLNSPGHKRNILVPSWGSMGIATAKGQLNYWVNDFSTQVITPAAVPTPTPTLTNTPTTEPTLTPAVTLIPSPTPTPIPPTATLPPGATGTPSPTIGASPTPTQTVTPSPTPLPVSTATPTTTQTPTITPTFAPSVAVNLSILLPGIGSSALPGTNANPVHQTRTFTVALFDSNGTVVKEAQVPLTFNSGAYTGTAVIPNTSPGLYTIKVKSDNSLYRAILGAKELSSTPTSTSQITLVTGNINNSGASQNLLDILDYSGLLSCYNGASCPDNLKLLTDLNDDGAVNSKDLNILLRGFATRSGD